ncbi:fumarylacetoacetate hydrolase family protein [Caballeronia novacaledonica]|uniref:Fumarylacetoacetate hydrolase family protein n=1 Tax=Caballeronia novacaledonica TaxID=1544861 RepID=A0AA37IHM0_9BURK|nr:fumarylacetoacetate hydrolase family protein [Caballeronia novacaledonica]GJH29377.1 fumarylacetoacetate hydrolase family protein [Caballeronia novacaledonica]
MKLATFRIADEYTVVGAIVDRAGAPSMIVNLEAAHGAHSARSVAFFSDMQAFIEGGTTAQDLAGELLERADIEAPYAVAIESANLLSPIPRPVQLRDFSVFEAHLRDAGVGLARLEARETRLAEPARDSGTVAQVYRDFPLFYFSNRMNVSGSGVQLNWPDEVELLDFELEIAAVIGKTAKDIPTEEAAEHIFGYTIFNDVSARDIQWRQMKGYLGPCKAKSYDQCNVLGPWIVTRDEMPTAEGLKACVKVNGAPWIETQVHGMVHSFADMVAFASRGETVYAGEVFGSGTVGGCCGLEMDRWIKRGDRVELEVEHIGTLVCNY